jgi:hypothetical protein
MATMVLRYGVNRQVPMELAAQGYAAEIVDREADGRAVGRSKSLELAVERCAHMNKTHQNRLRAARRAGG